MQQYSDEELIEVLKTTKDSRMQMAFDCLYLRYAKPIRQFFFFALQGDNEKAKDLVHDLFLKILESPEKVNSSLSFKPWIFRVASNMCKNEFRKRDVISRFRDHWHKTATRYTYTNENDAGLKESLNRLQEEQRALIVLRFKINLSIKEIADIYQCPEGTVKSRLFYAIKELSKYHKS
jgi:RNA polymerase sigma-70 factor (ECF subfamily)